MDEIAIQQASAILVKPANSWTLDENKLIYSLIKNGHRNALKLLRTQVLLDAPDE